MEGDLVRDLIMLSTTVDGIGLNAYEVAVVIAILQTAIEMDQCGNESITTILASRAKDKLTLAFEISAVETSLKRRG